MIARGELAGGAADIPLLFLHGEDVVPGFRLAVADLFEI
jgi:hypothetical protein